MPKRVVSTSEAEELANSQNIRLLKAVEETSEDCLRRVSNCATVVCQVLVCVESRQNVFRSHVWVFSLEVPISVFEGNVDSMSVDASKTFRHLD